MVICFPKIFPPDKGSRRWLITLVAAGLLSPVFCQEVNITDNDKKKMDPFEEHNLSKADKAFNNRQYRLAVADYDSFLLEFPQSRVRSYVLFRKARSIDLDNKRYDAIKKYTEVLDYFPNSTHYAAAALYYMGKCYMDTGSPENAFKAWLEMVQDKDYRQHFLTASALNKLAEDAWKKKNYKKAVSFYEQTVIDFRTSNPNAARTAMPKVLIYRVKTNPNEPLLRAFYVKAQGFNRSPQKIKDDPATSLDYWTAVRSLVKKFGTSAHFKDSPRNGRKSFFRYWANAMKGKFPDNDDFQIDYFDFRYAQDNDPGKRTQRLDTLFTKYQKPNDYTRIIKWIGLYKGNKKKINEYYSKLDLSKLSSADNQQLIRTLLAQKEFPMALNVIEKMPFKNMSDNEREKFARELWKYVRNGFSVKALEIISNSFTDKDRGAMFLLRYYVWTRNAKDGLPIAKTLKNHPQYASQALNIMGDFYFATRQYDKAILCYQQADTPPATLFKIADCYARMDKVNSAVATLREAENFFANVAPRAALQIASLYQKAGLRKQHVAALRGLMKKYPRSSESRQAHLALEKMGLKIGGGVDTDE